MSVTHGMYTAYARQGCRCDRCREYQNNRVRRNRAERLAAGRLNHGTRSAWDAGCRCSECLTAKRESDRKYAAWLKRKAAAEATS